MYGNAAHVCGAQKLLMRASMPYTTCHNDRFASTVSECFSRNVTSWGSTVWAVCLQSANRGRPRGVGAELQPSQPSVKALENELHYPQP